MSLWLSVLFFSLSIFNPTLAIGWEKRSYSEDTLKILSVLENRMVDQPLLEKTKDKLFTLSDGQTRLIASLSERVAREGNTTAGDIGFLLITVLITLL